MIYMGKHLKNPEVTAPKDGDFTVDYLFFYDISYVHDVSLVNLVQRSGMRSDFNDNLGGDFRISI